MSYTESEAAEGGAEIIIGGKSWHNDRTIVRSDFVCYLMILATSSPNLSRM
jgi:hypothetical protein